jgi:peptidoglycan/xylan/chitin deacetylase (PgdA/CDA1 family)
VTTPHPLQRARAFAIAVAAALIAGCATPSRPPEAPAPEPEPVARTGGVIASSDRFVIYVPEPGDSLGSIAKRFLGSESRQWEIADFNGVTQAAAGRALSIPLRPLNPRGVFADGYQMVPILTYHRVGPRVSRMVVTPGEFEQQLEYLKRNDYRVIRLADLSEFFEGRRPLPRRAVVITFDDGHVSSYQHAFPLLAKYGFPATFFLYTDFIGAKEALTWTQIREMQKADLIDFQLHSKTHANLIVRLPNESDQRYRDRLDSEVRVARDVVQRNIPGKVTHYAYPFGDANEVVLERLQRADFVLGLTVNAGGNAFFANPLMLRRTMIYGGVDMGTFRAALQVHRDQDLR